MQNSSLKRKTLINTFFDSLFAYCALVWMFHNRQLNTKMNNLHYRALRIIYRDETSTFDELLKIDGSITIHHRNIRSITIEMYKVQNGLASTFMREIFPLRNLRNVECVAGNIRSQVNFNNTANPISTNCGLETLRHLGPIVWNAIPKIIRDSPSLIIFKARVKAWEPPNCPCRLCKTYKQHIGFVNVANM